MKGEDMSSFAVFTTFLLQMIILLDSQALAGTLGNIRGYGDGNPREIFSRRPEKLLKYALLKFQ